MQATKQGDQQGNQQGDQQGDRKRRRVYVPAPMPVSKIYVRPYFAPTIYWRPFIDSDDSDPE